MNFKTIERPSLQLLSTVILSLGLFACQADTHSTHIIYPALSILTIDSGNPTANAVVIDENGMIVEAGDLNALKKRHKGSSIDTRFADKTIVPGLIDPHIHMTLGAMMYGLDFVPPWDMETPKGTVKGLPDKPSLMAKIAEFETAASAKGDEKAPLILYGYHNLVQGDLTRQDLDKVSETRPIYIWHFSGHDFYLNSAAITQSKLTPALAEKYHGVGLEENGELNGRIYEDAALALFQTVGPILLAPEHIKRGWEGYEAIFARSGVTSVAEMGYGIFGRALEDNYIKAHYSAEDNYNLYLVPEHRAFAKEFGADAPSQVIEMAAAETIPQVLPQVKLFTDAAFYSQTMKMAAPGYIGGQSIGQDGLWVTEPEDLEGLMRRYWDTGLDIHIHSNGDAAQDSTLNAFSKMKAGEDGQRLIIEHGGLFRPDQIQLAAELGIGISAASHYVKYMGEDYKEAIGEKTDFITPLASALRAGIHTTVHSDAPLAPPQPLKAASVHMTRETRQGGVSNSDERLTPEQALKAITLDAAWSLGLEDEIGSIEAGKRADFAILDSNPLTTAPEAWPDIKVWGVMLAGDIRPVQ